MISYDANVYIPLTEPSVAPIMVKVLPEPVWPYAKHVVLAPLNVSVTSGNIHSLYISLLSCVCSNTLSNVNECSSIYLVVSTFSLSSYTIKDRFPTTVRISLSFLVISFPKSGLFLTTTLIFGGSLAFAPSICI